MLRRLPLQRPSRPHQIAALLFAAIYIICAVLTAAPPAFTNASRPIYGVTDPLMSLPLAHTAADVDSVLSDSPSPDREVMRIKLNLGLALAASYLGLSLVLASAFSRAVSWGRVPAWVMSSFAILTAADDFRENRTLMRIVDTDLAHVGSQLLDQAHFFSIVKWALAATALLPLAIFLLAARRPWIRLIGGLDLLAAILLFYGSANPRVLDFAVVPLSAGLVLSAVTLRFVAYESASRNPVPRSVRQN